MAILPDRTYVQARSSGTAIPAGVFNDTIRANLRIAEVIGTSLEEVKKWGQQAQGFRNASDIREGKRKMREEYANFLMETQGDPSKGIAPLDPAQWGPVWQQRLDGINNSFKKDGAPPVVQRAIQASFDEFAGSSYLDISRNAFKENRRIALGTYQRDIQDLVDGEQYDEAREVAAELETFDPLVGRDAHKAIGDIQEKKDNELSREADPYSHREGVESSDLPEWEKKQELDKTDDVIRHQENDVMRNLEELQDSGVISTEDQVKEFLEANEAPEKLQNKLLASYRSKKPLTHEEKYSVLDKIIDDHAELRAGSITLDAYKRRHTESTHQTSLFGQRQGVGELKSLLFTYSPIHIKEGGDVDKEAVRKRAAGMTDAASTSREMVRERISGSSAVELSKREKTFEEKDDPVLAAKWKAKQRDHAVLIRSELDRQMSMWIDSRDTPPTPVEIRDYMNAIQPTVVERIMQKQVTPQKSDEERAMDAELLRMREELDGMVLPPLSE